MDQQNIPPQFNQVSQEKKATTRIIVGVIAAIVLIAGGVFAYRIVSEKRQAAELRQIADEHNKQVEEMLKKDMEKEQKKLDAEIEAMLQEDMEAVEPPLQ